MMSSGTVCRVGDLLDAIDPGQYSTDAELGSARIASDASEVDRDGIVFDAVDVKTPGGTLLVKGLTFRVDSGVTENLLVVGESGCGKTSIFRQLARLWPTPTGRILNLLQWEWATVRQSGPGWSSCHSHRTWRPG